MGQSVSCNSAVDSDDRMELKEMSTIVSTKVIMESTQIFLEMLGPRRDDKKSRTENQTRDSYTHIDIITSNICSSITLIIVWALDGCWTFRVSSINHVYIYTRHKLQAKKRANYKGNCVHGLIHDGITHLCPN